VRALVNQLAERDVVAPPTWAREMFGERPAHPRDGGQWDRGVRAVARYRVEHDVPAGIPGLGPEPPDQRALGAWRQASTLVANVHRQLGRSVERGRNHDRGSGLELSL
jgi:hypothetical protein